jgi:hydrogenase expression/formation protein HypE
MMPGQTPNLGKVSPEIFDSLILPRLGHHRDEVIVGPQHGVDVGIVDLGHDQVMVTTTDPFFVVPEYGWERAAWFAFHIVASDAYTSGLAPNYLTIDLNLPPEMQRDALETIWEVVHRECDRLGIAIVSGHTGTYENCAFPMIGGATLIGVGHREAYVTPAMARIGDVVVVTKGAAIETAGQLSVLFPGRISAAHGDDVARECEAIFSQMSVVDDARAAVKVGIRDAGVTSMHDATEFGVWGALVEVARASNVGLNIDKDAIILQDNVRKVCDLFEVDPFCASSEGTLVITCRPHKADALVALLGNHDIPASAVGVIVEPVDGLTYIEEGRTHSLEYPAVDPFWGAVQKAREKENE